MNIPTCQTIGCILVLVRWGSGVQGIQSIGLGVNRGRFVLMPDRCVETHPRTILFDVRDQ